MGLRYRKSVKLGPFRINFSKSGVGWSVGNKWARYTKKANGGTRVTRTIPGTGISYVEERRPGGQRKAAGQISEPMPPSVAEAPEKAALPDAQDRPSDGQSKRRIVLACAIIAALILGILAAVLIANRPIDYSDNWRDAPSRRVVSSQSDG